MVDSINADVIRPELKAGWCNHAFQHGMHCYSRSNAEHCLQNYIGAGYQQACMACAWAACIYNITGHFHVDVHVCC